MSILFPLVLMMVASVPPSVVADGDGMGECPSAHEQAEARVRNLLTTPLLPELRTHFDFGTASADDIQALTDERNSETCRALWHAVRTGGTSLSPGDRVSFYRSGNRFFVPIKRDAPHAPGVVIRLDGRSSVDVYDAEYRLVGRFGA